MKEVFSYPLNNKYYCSKYVPSINYFKIKVFGEVQILRRSLENCNIIVYTHAHVDTFQRIPQIESSIFFKVAK